MNGMADIEYLKNIKKDIVIDEEAFDRAVSQFQELCEDINKLLVDVGDMLTVLVRGYDTPAGKKFINACRIHVLSPILEQEKIINQIAKSLIIAKDGYRSVFEEYRQFVDYMSE